ncbi:heat shock protein 30-like [Hypanus sabinus]|uniref:heat shock protein 30-like n=1 Tax=Hypanus sabinus TaxID=79690 RepID=UPI0028C44CC5|nr:heat shock protein 30-like [Hypanus sabinus]
MRNRRPSHPSCLCQQPGNTPWPSLFTRVDPFELTAWKRVEQMRKGMNFIDRAVEGVAKQSWNESAIIQMPGADQEGDQGRSVDKSGDGFSVSLDVPRFSPEELKVKVLGRKVLVTGKYEKKSDDGSGSYSYRLEEFRREFQLPEDVDAQALECSLTRDGRLKVQAPRLVLPAMDERNIPINIELDTTSSPRLYPGEGALEPDSGVVGEIRPEGKQD